MCGVLTRKKDEKNLLELKFNLLKNSFESILMDEVITLK